jgi:hypothetical protein
MALTKSSALATTSQDHDRSGEQHPLRPEKVREPADRRITHHAATDGAEHTQCHGQE